jgi:uncharacterized protein (DUF362 family)
MSKVSLVKGEQRRKNVLNSLLNIEEETRKAIGEKQVLIKPNFVSSSLQKAATHIDQVRGILDFLSRFYKGKITIAEGSANDTFEGYENFGFLKLKEEYPFKIDFLDLNRDDYSEVEILKGEKVKVSRLALSSDLFIVSVAKIKTHDTVIATLSIKNLLMGMVIKEDKAKVHQGIKEINRNLLLLARQRMPDLASIDGYYSMEGSGPTQGDLVKTRVALAGLDPLAADRVALEIMGIDPEDVGYLVYCAKSNLGKYNLGDIELVGERLESCKTRKFKLHSSIERQLTWKK